MSRPSFMLRLSALPLAGLVGSDALAHPGPHDHGDIGLLLWHWLTQFDHWPVLMLVAGLLGLSYWRWSARR